MCVNYKGLNKACPKDLFPLPRIDQIVDSTSRCETLYFLDAYSSYHQITMKESDQLTTSFISPFGSFCYVTMPFGLKNAGARYQCCMLKCFRDLIGQTVEAYVDDIVVKSKRADQVVANLEQMTSNLTPRNAFLGSRGVCYWVLSSPSVASKPTWRRSRPSRGWACFRT